jgi:hypothetical protein
MWNGESRCLTNCNVAPQQILTGIFGFDLQLDMREYFVGDFNGTYNLDFYIRGFCMAGTLSLRSHPVNDIKCETGRAKIMDFFRQAIFYIPVADNDYALHRNSFCHGALYSSILCFRLVVKQAAINLQAIGGLGLIAPGVS